MRTNLERTSLRYMEVIMKVNFQEKFKEVLKKEAKGFGIDWQLVDIKGIHYQSTLMTELPMTFDEYMVRMRVIETKIPDMDNMDDWLRSHKFIYGMMSKSVRTDSEQTDMLTFDVGTIESIAAQIRDTFRNFHGQ